MPLTLRTLVQDFAKGMERADAEGPRSKKWQPGLGPHDEKDLIRLVVAAMGEDYARHAFEVAYPGGAKHCDVCIGAPPYDWAIEVKALRMLGDNGKPATGRDDVSKILSPYPDQHSALTDCPKILAFKDARQRAVMIYAWDFPDYPMAPVIDAFELLAARLVRLGSRESASFDGLMHRVHQRGAVHAWEILGPLES